MLSLVLTYRNRDLEIVKRCLASLKMQTDKAFRVFLINYGSSDTFTVEIERLVKLYDFLDYIFVPACGQLWNKSKAINIGLKKSNSKLVLIADIDMIFHPNLISKCQDIYQKFGMFYLQTGFLNKIETEKKLDFNNLKVAFKSSLGATGISLFELDALKSIGGYDEFYHGWGAEDTDVHLRLKNAGYSIYFYDQEILIKHQWHPKLYRSKKSLFPYHSFLEQINHQYMLQKQKNMVVSANQNYEWGVIPNKGINDSIQVSRLKITPESSKVKAVLFNVKMRNEKANIIIEKVPSREKIKNAVKKKLGKKYKDYFSINELNNYILEFLIFHHYKYVYEYKIDWKEEKVFLKIQPII
ncbi:glycosyltransferase family 2 protein [Zunongwangia sp.]|uniref:glycosyltransferase family 2 protein n=1 Tax=Zunongwangia sp. TaxID=1965325 RepID=UPI003AA85641